MNTPPKSRESLAKGLSKLIRRSGKTQKKIAKELEITESSISRWLHAREMPNSVTIDKLCAYFDVPPCVLFDGPVIVTIDLEKLAAQHGFRLVHKNLDDLKKD